MEDLVISCPLCRTETSLSSTGKGVAELRSAFHIQELLEIESGLKKTLANENYQELEQKKTRKKDEPKKPCQKHEHEEITLFCESCQEFTCLECTIDSHNGHQYNVTNMVTERCKRDPVF